MPDIWFSSDLHLQHSFILQFRKQFANTEEHDDTIIENWNERVKRCDRVYLLGDVILGRVATAPKLLARLNGQIYLVRGNHDRVADHKTCKDRFVWIKDYHRVKIGEQKIYCMHYPIESWNCMDHGSYHLCGHKHLKKPDRPHHRRLDVGVDGHDFRPWSYEEVDQILRDKPYPQDHHDPD